MNQNICLCYKTGKGIYTQNYHNCREAIFTTYDTKGYKTLTIDVPVENIKIRIESNLKFGTQAYLYAQIECNGKRLLDFTKDKIRVLNRSSVTKFSVPAGDWEALLKRIAQACRNKAPNICPTSAISYVDELCKILNSDSVEIKSAFHSGSFVKWNGEFLVTLLVGDKLRDLFDGLCEADIKDEVLTEHLLFLCRLFLRNLKSIKIDFADNRTIRLAQTLNYICRFMATHGAETTFLKFFHNTLSEKR